MGRSADAEVEGETGARAPGSVACWQSVAAGRGPSCAEHGAAVSATAVVLAQHPDAGVRAAVDWLGRDHNPYQVVAAAAAALADHADPDVRVFAACLPDVVHLNDLVGELDSGAEQLATMRRAWRRFRERRVDDAESRAALLPEFVLGGDCDAVAMSAAVLASHCDPRVQAVGEWLEGDGRPAALAGIGVDLREQIAERNALLHRLAGHFGGESLARRAELVTRHLDSYRAGPWQGERHLDDAPPHRDERRALCWRLCRLGCGVSPRTLRRILAMFPSDGQLPRLPSSGQ